jgi:hypothetical protein
MPGWKAVRILVRWSCDLMVTKQRQGASKGRLFQSMAHVDWLFPYSKNQLMYDTSSPQMETRLMTGCLLQGEGEDVLRRDPMGKPIMAKATAVWLVDNTTLTFKQIGDFTGMHELEVQGIADGDVATGVKGFDPVVNNQLTSEEIAGAEANHLRQLKLKFNAAAQGEEKRRGPRYTPLSKRQDRPASILWLVKFHPELSDSQIGKLVGTTKPTIQAIRERTHWNISNIQPIDPVALGLCKQSELDAVVQKAAAKKLAEGVVMSDDERRKLVSTAQSLEMPVEPKLAEDTSGLEAFALREDDEDEDSGPVDIRDADSFFNLPSDGGSGDEQP